MEKTMLIIISAIAGMAIGGFVLWFMQKKKHEKETEKILEEARVKAKALAKEKEIEAKENLLKLKNEQERELKKQRNEVEDMENQLRRKEQSLTDKINFNEKKSTELDKIKQTLNQQLDAIDLRKKDLEKERQKQVKKLEALAGLSKDEAKKELVEALKLEADSDAKLIAKQILDDAKLTAGKEAKRMVLQTIQRTAAEQAIENTVTVFNIENDEVKGRIIGREGRNIRALEAATGIEIIVDDTPEAIILSGFDAMRREIARLSLHRLVADGRIHPARIEEVVKKTKKEIEEEILNIGEQTVVDLGITGLHSELIRLVGKMRYRSSYGQNLLRHSREVANMCATMAAEFGLDPKLAKRAGLLHDIGKVPDDEEETPHALLGMKWAEKYGEHPEVCNAIGAHHDEIEMTSLLSPIVQACDAMSGSRPGARREDSENYVKRLQDLEKLALSFDGVSKAFAIQAGRELRVIVDSDTLDDKKADVLSFDISQKIMKEMIYPGQVKITVIRERRSVAFAK